MADKSSHAVQSTNDVCVNNNVKAVGSGSWDIDRRKDGSLLVRMHSVDRQGRPLPDAVFTFRKGDPQYEHWERQANQLQSP